MDYAGKAVIYKIINLTNAKFYVGSTVNWRARVRTHRRKLDAGTHHCTHLQAAWTKYGADAFVFRVIAEVDDADALHTLEQVYLDEHHGSPQCYNMARYTDNSTRGVPHSQLHKQRLSEALKRHYETNPHPRQGKPHLDISKALMKVNRAGKTVSESTKEKLRAANLGKTATEVTRAKLSAMRKGKVRSEGHAAKYNKAIVEITSGEVFPSLKAVKERFGMSPGMLAKALDADRPLLRGANAGRHFRYVTAD